MNSGLQPMSWPLAWHLVYAAQNAVRHVFRAHRVQSSRIPHQVVSKQTRDGRVPNSIPQAGTVFKRVLSATQPQVPGCLEPGDGEGGQRQPAPPTPLGVLFGPF